jgi:hypothetical protein
VTLRLRDLGLLARLGIAGLVLTMLGGTAASGMFLAMHQSERDQRAGLTIDDVRAHYHGLISPSPLVGTLQEGHPEGLDASVRDRLLEWLAGNPLSLSGRYDDLDLGSEAPAELIAAHCVRCHARAATAEDAAPEIPLEYWDDVYALAISRDIRPVDTEILAASTHTHALGMASMGIAIAVLAVMTGWSRRLVGPVLAATGLGLAADLSGWWLTRLNDAFAVQVVAGGLLFTCGVSVLSLLILADLCMPRAGRNQAGQ